MYRVIVFMTTYNGEHYLREQLDSILSQQDVEISLHVGDDRSSDSTTAILDEYAAKYPNVHYFVNEQNLGYRKNFMNLIDTCEEKGDFYALSDQDDKWLPNKLSAGIKYMQEHGYQENTPFLYSCNPTCYSHDLTQNLGSLLCKAANKANAKKRFILNTATGCTCIFNQALKDLLVQYPLDMLVVPHDEVISKLAVYAGRYCFDATSYIQYRQHGNNLIGQNKEGRFKKYWNVLIGKTRMHHGEVASYFYAHYQMGSEIKREESFFKVVGTYRKNFLCRLRMCFSPRYNRWNLLLVPFQKIAVLFGRY